MKVCTRPTVSFPSFYPPVKGEFSNFETWSDDLCRKAKVSVNTNLLLNPKSFRSLSLKRQSLNDELKSSNLKLQTRTGLSTHLFNVSYSDVSYSDVRYVGKSKKQNLRSRQSQVRRLTGQSPIYLTKTSSPELVMDSTTLIPGFGSWAGLWQEKKVSWSDSGLATKRTHPTKYCHSSALGTSLGDKNERPRPEIPTFDLTGSSGYHKDRLYKSLVCLDLQSMYPSQQLRLCDERRAPRHQRRHQSSICQQHLLRSGDVHENPGPKDESTAMVISYNVRGINEENKLRHLVNYCYSKSSKDKDVFHLFQETFITKPNKIPFLWRGNFHLTPGTGNSCGCLTLVSNHLNLIEAKNIGNRGHVLACQKSGEVKVSYLIANVYAPCPNSQEKIDFFEEVFNVIGDFEARYDCRNIIIAGDFNLNFDHKEMKNRNYSAQENRVSKIIKNFATIAGLTDIWKKSPKFTWRRPNSDIFSTIDRVLINNNLTEICNVETNWALSLSDHAAIELYLKARASNSTKKSRITRLDPSLLDNEVIKNSIISNFEDLYKDAGEGWNPHLKLEFAKMCIRTVAEKAQSDRKKKDASEEEEVNEELNLAFSALEEENLTELVTEELIETIEELRCKKARLVEEKGKRLASKLGTKWYNEGEKSTKYFLRLLNPPSPDNFKIIEGSNGEEITGQDQIEKEIVKFYSKLYEEYDKSNLVHTDVNDEFFNEITPVSGADEKRVVDPVGLEELGRTLAGCADSAPGPDGIPYSYYKALWRTMGPLMVEAWSYTVRTGNLCESHKVSFLKLIPKPNKDLKKLTNWRPITLSNCDHKLITKTYSNRMSSVVAEHIKERQTAYIKGRLINDNIRAILASINLTNSEPDLDGLLVSLDAKKAFDSVEHSYIEKCLIRFGLRGFVPIFRVLYSELKSDIVINGRIVKGYRILRGVKQGDALSCILFIICMEPLLCNIEKNPLIKNLETRKLGTIPGTYAFADDVNVLIQNSPEGLQEIFNEYGRLTRASGLELNADKTEIMQLNSRCRLDALNQLNFNVRYMARSYRLVTVPQIKVNGIMLQQNEDEMINVNIESAIAKIDNILKRWSARSLSILGKILILKTFAISQLIYVMQSMVLSSEHFKRINQLLYKFIWNRHYLAAKAPERIKREIVNAPIEAGGFGMLDVAELDKSLKLKALARIVDSKHPFLMKVKENLKLDNFFAPTLKFNLERVSCRGVELLKEVRLALVGRPELESNLEYIVAIKNSNLKYVLNERGRNSVTFLVLRNNGVTKLGELGPRDLERLRSFMNKKLFDEARRVINIPNVITHNNSELKILKGKRLIDLRKLSSKDIRGCIKSYDPICVYKTGLVLTPSENLNWTSALRKVKSVRHKSILLRVSHGDIYSKERLTRFGLTDSPLCPRCGTIETTLHKLIECSYVARIWDTALQLTNKLKAINQPNNADLIQAIMGATSDTDPLILSIHAEIFLRILRLRDDANFLIRPKVMVRLAIEPILRSEKAGNKRRLEALLE